MVQTNPGRRVLLAGRSFPTNISKRVPLADTISETDQHRFKSATDTHPIEQRRLGAHLAAVGLRLDDDVEIRQFATGLANINYRLSIDGIPVVLRRPPAGDLPPGAHDMKREHHILSRLHQAHPLAPRSLHLCEDTTVLGVPFQIIEYRPGLVIKGDDKSNLDGAPERCARLGEMLIETLVSVHRVDVDVIGLGDFGRPEGFIERAIDGWRARAERLQPVASTAALATEIGDWLAAQPRAERAPTLLHSDFKLDNLILEPETLQPRAIVDWDMGTRGDPLFDLATLLSYWTEPDDPECMHRLAQMPTTAAGFPDRSKVVSTYAAITGIDVSDFPVLRVLAMYKLAVVFLQLHALYGRGPDADPRYTDFDKLGEDLFLFTRDTAKAGLV